MEWARASAWDVDDSPCPAIEALEKEGKTNAEKADDAIVDSILLQGAAEVEHHEIAVYENLVINARAMEDLSDEVCVVGVIYQARVDGPPPKRSL